MHRANSSPAFDFVEEISDLDCPDTVVAAFSRAVGRYGFSALALGELPAPNAKTLNPFFVSTWKPALAAAYVGEGLFREDPSIEVARCGALPSMWSDLEARWRAAERSTRAFQFAAAHGFREGVVIPVHGPGSYRGLVALLGEATELPLRDRAAIHLMALYLHEKLRELMAPQSTALPGASAAPFAGGGRMPEMAARRQDRLGDGRNPRNLRGDGALADRAGESQGRRQDARPTCGFRRPARLRPALRRFHLFS